MSREKVTLSPGIPYLNKPDDKPCPLAQYFFVLSDSTAMLITTSRTILNSQT